MGYINNQWLKASPERGRAHGPVKVTMEAQKPSNKWDEAHGVLVQLRVTRHNGDYQHVLFTAEDLSAFVTFLLREGQTRNVLTKALGQQSDDEFLDLLARTLQVRSATSNAEKV